MDWRIRGVLHATDCTSSSVVPAETVVVINCRALRVRVSKALAPSFAERADAFDHRGSTSRGQFIASALRRV